METMDMQAIVKFVHEIVKPVDPTPTPTPTPPEYVDPVTGAVNAASSGTGDPLSWLFIALIVIAALGSLYLFASKKLGFSFRWTTATPVGAHVSPTLRHSSSQKKRKKAASKLGFFAIALCAVIGIGGIGTQAISANAASASNNNDTENVQNAQTAQAANDETQQKAVFTITKSDEGKTVITGNDQPIIAHVYDDGQITYDNFTLKNETGDFVEVSKTKLQSLIDNNNANWTFTITGASNTNDANDANDANTNQIYNGLAYPKGEEVTQRSWTYIAKDQAAEVTVTSTLDHATAQTLYEKETVKLGLDAMIHPVEVNNIVDPKFKILDLNKDPYTNNVIKVPQGKDLNFYVDKEEGKDIEVIWTNDEGTTKNLTPGAEEKYMVEWNDIYDGGTLTIYEAYSVVVSLGGGILDSSSKVPDGWTYDSVNNFYYKTYKAGTEVSSVEAEWSHKNAYITNTTQGKTWARYNPDQWDSTFKTKYVDMKGGILSLKWTEGVTITRNTDYSAYLAIADSEGVAYSDKEWKDNKMVVPKGAFSFKVNLTGGDEGKEAKIIVQNNKGNDYEYDPVSGLYSTNLTGDEEINTYEMFKATINMQYENADLKLETTQPTGWTKNTQQIITYDKYFYRYVSNPSTYSTTGSTIKKDWGFAKSESYDEGVTTESNRNYLYADHWFLSLGIEDNKEFVDNTTIDVNWGEKKSPSSITVKDEDNNDITEDNPLSMNINVHDDQTQWPTVTAKYITTGNPGIEFPTTGEKSPQWANLPEKQEPYDYYKYFGYTIGVSTEGTKSVSHSIKIDPTPNYGTEDLNEKGLYTFTLTYPETDNFKKQVATFYVKIIMNEADFTLEHEITQSSDDDTAIDMPYDSSATNDLTWNPSQKPDTDVIRDYDNMSSPEIRDAEVVTSKGVDISKLILIRYNMSHSQKAEGSSEQKIDMSLINVAPNLEGSAEEQAAVKAAILKLINDGDTSFTVTFCLPKSAYYKKTSNHTFNVNITKADSDIVVEDGDDYYADETVDEYGNEYRNIYIYSSESEEKLTTANVKVKTNANASLKKEAGVYQATLSSKESEMSDPTYSKMNQSSISKEESSNTYTIPVVAGTSASGNNCDWLTVPFDETTTGDLLAAAKTFKFRVFVIAKKATLSGLTNTNIELGGTITQDLKYVGVPQETLKANPPTVKIYDGADTEVTSTNFELATLEYQTSEASVQTWKLTVKAKVYTDIEQKNIVPLDDYKVKIDFPEDSTAGWNAVSAESKLTVIKQTPNKEGYDPATGINVELDVWTTNSTTLNITNAPSTYDMSLSDNTVVSSTYDATTKALTTQGLAASNSTESDATAKGVLSFPETTTTNAASFNINYTVNKVSKTAQWSTQPTITQANVDYRIACDVLAYTGDASQTDNEKIELGTVTDGTFEEIENSKVTYDTAYNELVVMCPTAMENTTAYIKFPETANCSAAISTDGETGKYGTIKINIEKQKRNLKLYEVGSKRNEIAKDSDGNYVITLTKQASEASVTGSAQARFNGDDNAPSTAEFKTNASSEEIEVSTTDNVVGTFVCKEINEYTIMYSLDGTDEYEATSATLKIKFTRTVTLDAGLLYYMAQNDGITLAGSGVTSVEAETSTLTEFNRLEVHPTVAPNAKGTNSWSASTSDDSIAIASVTQATTDAPKVTIKALSEGTAYITIKVTDTAITKDPGAIATIKVNVLPDYAYGQVTTLVNDNDITINSLVKNYKETKTDITPNKTIEVTTYDKDISGGNSYYTKSYTLNGLGDQSMSQTVSTFTNSVKSVNLNNWDEVYIAEYAFCGANTTEDDYIHIESFSTKKGAVKYLGWGAFKNCKKLRQFDFSSYTAITSIPKQTFYNCTSLSDVTIPSNITSIDFGAFYNCSSLKSIDLSAMNNSSGVTIGQTTDYFFTPGEEGELERGAFANCTSVETIKMPTALTQIGRYAFYNNSSVTSITGMNAENIYYGAFSGCSAIKDLDLSSSTNLTTITYTGPDASAPSATVEAQGSFANCYNLELIKMPESSKTLLMNGYSFAYDYTLKYMTIHHTNKVTTKSKDFYGYKQLRNFVLCQESVTGNDISTDTFRYTHKGGNGEQTKVPLMTASYETDNSLNTAQDYVDWGDASSCESDRTTSGDCSQFFTFTVMNPDDGMWGEINSGKYYYLKKDIVPNIKEGLDGWEMGTDVEYCFDLNGNDIGYVGTSITNKHVFVINHDKTRFRIDDSSSLSEDSVGKITGCNVTGKGGAIWCDSKSGYKIFFVNGNITENSVGEDGGGIYMWGNNTFPSLYMFGGWITNNKTTGSGKSGGGVFLKKNVNMYQYGGHIENNTATNHGGGVFLSQDGDNRGYYDYYGGTCINDYCQTSALGGVYDDDGKSRFMIKTSTLENGKDYYYENEQPATTSDFTYALNSDSTGLILTGYKGTDTTATVPEYDYYTTTNGATYYLPVVQAGNGSAIKSENETNVSLSFAENSQVQNVNDYAFYGDNGFSKVSLPSSVTAFGEYVFYKDISLESVDISKVSFQDTILPSSTFSGCTNLRSENIKLPESIEWVGGAAFENCTSLESIDFLPASITAIGTKAFSNTGVTSLDTSKWKNLYISERSFQNCSELTSINIVNGANLGWESSGTVKSTYTFSGCSKLKDVTFNTTGNIGKGTFAKDPDATTGCSACANIENISINCKILGEGAFKGCSNLKNINVVANTIEQNAFAMDSTETTNNESTFYIQANKLGSYLLKDRNKITNLDVMFGGVGSSTETCDVANYVYADFDNNAASGICEVNINKSSGWTLEATNLFDGSLGIKSADFSSTDIASLPSSMFANCAYLDTVYWNKDLTSIGKHAFENCVNYSNLDMSWAKSLQQILYGAFSGCTGITDIYLEENYELQLIDASAFSGLTNLKYLDLPSGTKATSFTSIGAQAFMNCTALVGDYDTDSLDISSSITSLGTECFSGCTALRYVNFEGGESGPGSLDTVGDKTFGGCTNISEVDFSNTQVTTLHDDADVGAMYGCTNLRKLTLPASYTAPIAPGDYGKSENITEVDMSLCTQVTEFGENAFKDKKKLATIDLPETGCAIIKIGDYAFSGCSALKTFGFEHLDQLTTIGNYAFNYCTALESVDTTKLTKLSKIGDYAFYYCNSLAGFDFTKLTGLVDVVTLNAITPALGAYSFANCSALTTVDFSNNTQIYAIPEGCFQHCTGLSTLVLPYNIKRVEAYAFYGDTKLDNVDFNSQKALTENLTIEYVGHDAFKNTAHFNNATYKTIDGIVFDKSKVVAMGVATDTVPQRLELLISTRVVAAYCLENCSSLRWLIIDETDGHKIYMNDYCITNCPNMTNLVVKQRTSSEDETVDNDNIVWGDNVLENAGSVGKSDSEHAIVPMVVTGGANTKAKFSSYAGVNAYTYYPVLCSPSTSFPALQDKYYYYLDGDDGASLQVSERISSSSSADCVLDLNGHNLTRGLTSQVPYGQVISFSGNSLRLDDSSTDGDGSITQGMSTWKTFSVQDASYGGGVYVSKSGVSLYFVRGTIANCKAFQGGGIYIQNQAKVYMYDGAIIDGCQATYNKYMWGGGAIMMAHHSEFYMHGGIIRNCRAYNEGGAILANCRGWNTFKMRLYGGTFKDNYIGTSGTKRNDITAGTGWTGHYDLKGNLKKNVDYIFREDHWI